MEVKLDSALTAGYNKKGAKTTVSVVRIIFEGRNMEGKKRYLYIGLFALLLMLVLVPAQSVEAGSNINPTKKTLKTDKTYASYDITGDNQADKIRINTYWQDQWWMTGGEVVINGKTCYTIPDGYYIGVEAELYTLNNGTPYLHICTFEESDWSDIDVLLQYKSGKLKTALNLYKTVSKFGSPIAYSKIKVSGNTMKIKFVFDSYTTAYTTLTYKYKYKNGALKRTSNKTTTFSLDSSKNGKPTFTTAKKLTTYSSPTSKKTKALAKGTKVKITQVYMKGNNLYLKYKTTKTNKTGWIKCYKKYHSKDAFKNLHWFS